MANLHIGSRTAIDAALPLFTRAVTIDRSNKNVTDLSAVMASLEWGAFPGHTHQSHRPRGTAVVQ